MAHDRLYRAGTSVEDYCRACKTDRLHTVIVVDEHSQPLRVTCDYCRSEHNFRGGARVAPSGAPAFVKSASPPPRSRPGGEPFPIVSDKERTSAPMNSSDDLELLLRRIIREEAGVTPVTPAEKWRGGTLVLRPGNPALQEKSWPIETFFHKVVMMRNRLRTLEQHVNASGLPEDVKLKLQSYVSGCYGTLTSFNVLFADEDDHFKSDASDQ